MGIADSIAAQSMSMHAAEFNQQYSIAVAKKAMDAQEMVGQELLEMLPQVPKGQYVDILV